MNDEIEDRDPIVAEVRRARAELLAQYDGDLNALVADMQRKTEEARVTGRQVVTLAPRRPKGWSDSARKVG